MPYYGMPVGTEHEEVGFGFNRQVITGLLREQLGFDGIVCTDWGLLTDSMFVGEPMLARAWGVEHLTPLERAQKALDAGVDQFGGEAHPGAGRSSWSGPAQVSEERIDVSVRRLLREKFVLGLFDAPPLDVDDALADHRPRRLPRGGRGRPARRDRPAHRGRSGPAALPLATGARVYVEGIDAAAAGRLRHVVDDPADADVAILRLDAPFEERPAAFETLFHAGSLDFPSAEQRTAAATSPHRAHRRRRLPGPAGDARPLADAAAALLVELRGQRRALLDVLFGRGAGRGRLPFDLPRPWRR